ncbi:MAG TPA: hypothetical protein VGE40_13200 [Bacilli bacterium]
MITKKRKGSRKRLVQYANENLQMNYWQALSGNMSELLLAVFDYSERLLDDFKENARKFWKLNNPK